MAFQMFVKVRESRNSDAIGPLSYASPEERERAALGPGIFWYHYAEEDDWFLWKRGGAWAATQEPGREDIVPPEPEITERDRW